MTETLGGVWQELVGRPPGDEIVAWAPDVFLLTDVVLQRTEIYRFVVSPPPARTWPPYDDWGSVVNRAGRQWTTTVPDVVSEAWAVVMGAAQTPLDEISSGEAWPVVAALLTLHAAADEMCGGLSRTLLAGRNSFSRLDAGGLQVLPKMRTPPAGISPRSLSRYACVARPPVGVVWDIVPDPPPGVSFEDRDIRLLLLPWPLTLDDAAFVPVEGSVRRPEQDPYGFFRFEPGPLDLSLLDRVLAAAGPLDAVILPEGAVAATELPALEDALARHGVPILFAGVREHGRNWVHIAVLVPSGWHRYAQNKHHRWSLDRSQVEQYHLGDVLDPGVRWWEEMDVPRRSIRFVEFAEGVTVVSLICEDLARLDDVAELVRSVGPTLVVTPLLDGPQLPSRWTARYASVLADDPGSAVVTLSCLGMVERSRPPGLPASRVVSLWKDPVRGVREISLDEGAQGVVVAARVGRTSRHTADGRSPVTDTADFYVVDITQVAV